MFLHFCSFQPTSKNSAENGGKQNNRHSDRPNMAYPKLVAISSESDLRRLLPQPNLFSYIRKALRKKGVQKQARGLILKSWRMSTKKQYNSYNNKWSIFCGQQINPLQPSINDVLKFLSEFFAKGLQYRSLGTARSATSTFLKLSTNLNINKFDEGTRFIKGAFLDRPALPRYTTSWSVDTVLQYLKSSSDTTLLQLSCKLCILFLSLSAQRCQTLHLISLSDVKMTNYEVFIAPQHILKQTKPGIHLDMIRFKACPKDKNLCIVSIITEYLRRTENH